MPLADNVTVYPAHGAGSACGKNMMKETVDTLGNQKKINYALRVDMTKGEFIKEVTEGLMPPPQYFPTNVKMNKEGYEDIDSILVKGTQALPVDEFEVSVNETGAIVLDVRNKYDFAKGHIPKSIFIGLDGDFAPWVGALIADVQQPILLVAPEGREEEAVTRLSRVGFDNALGFLKGGLNAWREKQKECDTLSSINPQEFAAKGNNKIIVIDVRKPNEYQAEHIKDAKNIPLSLLNDKLTELPKKSTFYIHCAGGYRSVIASSILKAKGMHNMINIEEGFDALKTIKGISKTNYVCPSTIR